MRFVQLYHRGWDQHGTCRATSRCSARTDQPSAALVTDLKQRGLLDDTLVVWGGEFGRTAYSQGKLTDGQLRPRPPPAASPCGWPAAGVKRGLVHGETDDFGYNVVEDPVHVHDLHATILHLLGIDHSRLTSAATTCVPTPDSLSIR